MTRRLVSQLTGQIVGVRAGTTSDASTGAGVGSDMTAGLIICNGQSIVSNLADLEASALAKELKDWGRVVFGSANELSRIFRDLLAAYQTGKLNEANFSSYFASIHTHSMSFKRVNDLLKTVAPFASNIYDENSRNQSFPMTPWHTYRRAASASPALVSRAINDLGNIANRFFTVAETAAVNDALAHPGSLDYAKRIPTRALMLTSAYLESQDALPKSWYQGKAAVQMSSPAQYSAAQKFFKRLMNLSTDVSGIDENNTVDDMLNSVPQFMSAQ